MLRFKYQRFLSSCNVERLISLWCKTPFQTNHVMLKLHLIACTIRYIFWSYKLFYMSIYYYHCWRNKIVGTILHTAIYWYARNNCLKLNQFVIFWGYSITPFKIRNRMKSLLTEIFIYKENKNTFPDCCFTSWYNLMF